MSIERHLLLCIVSQVEGGWTVPQQGNNLLDPEILDNLGEPGMKQEFGAIDVASVTHNKLAIGL